MALHVATSTVENLAQGLSCQLKFVHAGPYLSGISYGSAL